MRVTPAAKWSWWFGRLPGQRRPWRRFDYHNIHVAYTKEGETGDQYIERITHEIGKNDTVRVVTSDGLVQLSALRSGVLRMSAREFHREVERVARAIGDAISQKGASPWKKN